VILIINKTMELNNNHSTNYECAYQKIYYKRNSNNYRNFTGERRKNYDKPNYGQLYIDKLLNGQPSNDKLLNGQPSNDKPFIRQPSNDKPFNASNDKPFNASNDKPLNGQPSNDKPLNRQPSNDKLLNGQPSNDKLLNGQLSNDKSLNRQPSNDKLLNGQPSNYKSLNRQPSNDKLLNEQLSNDKSLNRQPSNDKLLNGQPSNYKPFIRQPSNDKPFNASNDKLSNNLQDCKSIVITPPPGLTFSNGKPITDKPFGLKQHNNIEDKPIFFRFAHQNSGKTIEIMLKNSKISALNEVIQLKRTIKMLKIDMLRTELKYDIEFPFNYPINNEYLCLCNHETQIRVLQEFISEMINLDSMVKMLF